MSASLVTTTCRECGKEFSCPANQAPRREVCVPRHPKLGRPRCACCACAWDRRRRHEPNADYMTGDEIQAFLLVARKISNGYCLAFQLAVNAMLRLHELVTVKASHLEQGDVCRLTVNGVKIDLDCETIELLSKMKPTPSGRLLPYSKRTLQRAFRTAVSKTSVDDRPLYEYTFNALRATGIAMRVAAMKTPADFEVVRQAARLFSPDALTRYMPKPKKETSTLLNRVKFPKLAKLAT